LANSLQDSAKVPMTEIEPCEKSHGFSSFSEVEEKHPEWVKTCAKNATKVVTKEFNRFHKKFAKFIDRLAWSSGCGARADSIFGDAKGTDGWGAVSEDFDAGLWSTCDWSREEKSDENLWELDEERARGFFGWSKIGRHEQQKAKIEFTMPLWLANIRRYQKCFQTITEGHVEGSDQAERAETAAAIMGPMENGDFSHPLNPSVEQPASLSSIISHESPL